MRLPDDGGADEVVAAIGKQILGPTDVSLANWTVRPSSGCSVVHTVGVVSVDGYTLTHPGSEPVEHRAHLQLVLFTCRYFVVYTSEADNVYDPLYGSFAGDQGA